MNPPKCTDGDYIDFLVAGPRQVSATEAERVPSERAGAPARDAFARPPHRLEPDAAAL